MTVPSDLDTAPALEVDSTPSAIAEVSPPPAAVTTVDEDDGEGDDLDDVEMSLFDHLEELRLRIFYALMRSWWALWDVLQRSNRSCSC
jgi:sec-independent protein translocase protein TatC